MQIHTSHRAQTIATPDSRHLNTIFGNLFEPLEPPTPRRECMDSLTAVVATDADETRFDETDALTDSAA